MELLQRFHPALLACSATGRRNGFVHIAHIFSRVISFVNFRTYCDEIMYLSLIDKDYVLHCIHRGQSYSGNKVDREPESDDYFNGKNHEEKNVFGDGKIFKNLVSFLQKTSAYRRGVHPEEVIGSGALPRCRTGHFVLLVG